MTRKMMKDARGLLERSRNADGGFGARPGQPSEAEPTALAALALNDAAARAWLLDHQAWDGSFSLQAGPYTNDSATPLAALALEPGRERDRALDHIEETRARRVPSTAEIPIDPTAIGWGWATATASWVDPTAKALWALRTARPSSGAIVDAVALLRDRESVGGGWNYGNRVVLGEELPPFAQTTAIALIGLAGLDPQLGARGIATLRRLWRAESAGVLSLASAVLAFRVHRADAEARAALATLADLLDRVGSDDTVALGWAASAMSQNASGTAA